MAPACHAATAYVVFHQDSHALPIPTRADGAPMTLFSATLCIHVVAAILGLGPVAGLALLVGTGSSTTDLTPRLRALMVRLTRWTSLALGLVLVSGIVLESASGGSFHDTWWFRISFLLLLGIGALNGLTRRRLRKLGSEPDASGLRAVSRMAWAMCAIVAVVAVLMTARPW
jgi:hypothetical protein